VAQVIECLPNKLNILSSKSNVANKQKQRQADSGGKNLEEFFIFFNGYQP
jgi:hypothetical protein